MPDVPLDPFEPVPATDNDLVDLLEQVEVHYRFSVALAPALGLPPFYPLGNGVDYILAVAQDEQIVIDVRGGAKQLEHGFQLALVIGCMLPSAGSPARVVDVPSPARRSRISEGRAVSGGGDRHEWAFHKADARAKTLPVCHLRRPLPVCCPGTPTNLS